MYEPVRFDENDKAEVDVDVFNEWIGDDMARVVGIVVTRPPDKKKPAKKKAKATSK